MKTYTATLKFVRVWSEKREIIANSPEEAEKIAQEIVDSEKRLQSVDAVLVGVEELSA
jgi:hypothetical protein